MATSQLCVWAKLVDAKDVDPMWIAVEQAKSWQGWVCSQHEVNEEAHVVGGIPITGNDNQIVLESRL